MDVPADGTIIQGANAKGKTSVLNLIRVALVEKGATKDMIKREAQTGKSSSAWTGHFRRRVMHGGDKFPTHCVTDPDGCVGPRACDVPEKPVRIEPLDPIELFLRKGQGQASGKILSAIPCGNGGEQGLSNGRLIRGHRP